MLVESWLMLVELGELDVSRIHTHPIVKLSWIPGRDHSLASTVFAQSRIYLGSKSCASVKFKSVVCARTRAQKKNTFMKRKGEKYKKVISWCFCIEPSLWVL